MDSLLLDTMYSSASPSDIGPEHRQHSCPSITLLIITPWVCVSRLPQGLLLHHAEGLQRGDSQSLDLPVP